MFLYKNNFETINEIYKVMFLIRGGKSIFILNRIQNIFLLLPKNILNSRFSCKFDSNSLFEQKYQDTNNFRIIST